jgi:hypothetical protein
MYKLPEIIIDKITDNGMFLVGFLTLPDTFPTIKNESKANIIAGNDINTPVISN